MLTRLSGTAIVHAIGFLTLLGYCKSCDISLTRCQTNTGAGNDYYFHLSLSYRNLFPFSDILING